MSTWVQGYRYLLYIILVTTTHTCAQISPPPPTLIATGNKEAADSPHKVSDEHKHTITHLHHKEGSQPLEESNSPPKHLSLTTSSCHHDSMSNEMVRTQSTQSMTPESVTRGGYSSETPVESPRPAPPAGGGHGSRYPHTG